jgi:hypothetical protein
MAEESRELDALVDQFDRKTLDMAGALTRAGESSSPSPKTPVVRLSGNTEQA